MEDDTIVRKRLIYEGEIFYGGWKDFLKNCNVDLYTSRKESRWYSVRGKGYIIWISPFRPAFKDGLRVWESVFEISRNAPAIGFENRDEIIEGALQTFKEYSVEDF